jgi:hypothetical protein
LLLLFDLLHENHLLLFWELLTISITHHSHVGICWLGDHLVSSYFIHWRFYHLTLLLLTTYHILWYLLLCHSINFITTFNNIMWRRHLLLLNLLLIISTTTFHLCITLYSTIALPNSTCISSLNVGSTHKSTAIVPKSLVTCVSHLHYQFLLLYCRGCFHLFWLRLLCVFLNECLLFRLVAYSGRFSLGTQGSHCVHFKASLSNLRHIKITTSKRVFAFFVFLLRSIFRSWRIIKQFRL